MRISPIVSPYGPLFAVAALTGCAANRQDAASNSERTGAEVIRDTAFGGRLGAVDFPVSCRDAAAQHAERGLALLHHMTYEGARAAFADAVDADSDCAMGFWGQAMTYIHPLWSDPPGEEEFRKGRERVDQARNRGNKTEREEAYIAAVEAYYAPGRSRDEKENLAQFEEGWRKVHQSFPEDPEAASFHALAHLATADPEDKSYAKQKRALGSARNGDHQAAQQALDRLDTLRAQAGKASGYWAKQVAIQRQAAMAWLSYGQGRQEEALARMEEAAKMEAETEKHPVTPGEVLPARELFADMLLEAGNPGRAETEYLAALERSPNRFNSLHGAGRAAELEENFSAAASHYEKLLEIAVAGAERERLQHAKEFLAEGHAAR